MFDRLAIICCRRAAVVRDTPAGIANYSVISKAPMRIYPNDLSRLEMIKSVLTRKIWESLKRLLTGDHADFLTTVVAFNAGHGMTVGSKYVTLNRTNSYPRFFRATPRVRIEMLEFLRINDLTDF